MSSDNDISTEDHAPQFELGCPYYRGQDHNTIQTLPPMFRFIQEFSDLTVYVGDSFGGRAYTDASTSAKRDCSAQCACRLLATQLEKHAVFTAYKTAERIQVKIESKTLWSWLQPILISRGEWSVRGGSKLVNGHVLLQHLDHLNYSLKWLRLKEIMSHDMDVRQLRVEFYLLCFGFLTDEQVFQGQVRSLRFINYLGLDYSHRLNFRTSGLQRLDDSRRSAFQISRVFCHIARLKTAFHAIDKAESSSNAQQLENNHGNTEKLSQPHNPIYSAVGRNLSLAARKGNEAEVRRLLDEKMNPNLDLPGMGVAPPLIEAIWHGHISIVRMLIARGANVNRAVEGKCRSQDQLPLLEAVRAGRSQIIKLLLDGGAAPIPSSYLPEPERLRLAQSRSYQGFDPSTLLEGLHRKQVLAATRKIHRLYREFRNNFAKVTLCAQAPSARTTCACYRDLSDSLPKWLPPRLQTCIPWGVGFCEDYSTAWDVGIGVMRDLCQGKPPSCVKDTILFLCLTQAMAVVMDDQHGPILEAEFMKDLGRWQSLFIRQSTFRCRPDCTLVNFQRAVASIWDVDLRNSDRAQNPDPEALLYFQGLARSLMDCAAHYFDLAALEGSSLLSSQAQWRLDRNTEASHRQQDDPDQPQTLETPNSEEAFDASGLPGSAGPNMTMKGSQNYRHKLLKDSMCSDQGSSSQQSIVDLLMAGAIFMIFIMFLLWLQSNMALSPLAEFNTVFGVAQLEAALRHLLSAVKTWISLGEVVVKAIKAFIVDAIRRGHVANYAALASFAVNKEFAERLPVDLPEANRIQQYFLKAWALWESTYALQERYHILERFLGFSGSTRIVPDVDRPRTCSDMLNADARGAGQETKEVSHGDSYSAPIQAPRVDSPLSSEAAGRSSGSQSLGTDHTPSSPEQLYASAASTQTALTTPTPKSSTLTSPVPASVNRKTYC